MPRLSAWMLAVLVALPPFGAAAEGGFRIELDGEARLGYGDHLPEDEPYLSGDASLFVGYGQFPVLLELGLYGYGNDRDTPHETYGALAYRTTAGQLSVGVPRPAYDAHAVPVLDRAFPLLGFDRTLSTRSHVTYGSMFLSELQYGIAWHGAAGDLRYSVSVHDVPDSPDRAASAGVTWTSAALTLSGAVEVVDDETDTSANVKVRAERSFGDFTLGGGYYYPDSREAPDFVEGSLSYRLNDRTTLTAVAQGSPGDADSTIVGLAGEVRLRDWLSLHAGAARDPSGDAAIDLGIGFAF